MRKLLLIAALFFCHDAQTQTLQQWAQLVNWDGVSHFSKYIHLSAGYMGPNALTVPYIGNGSIDSLNTAGLSAQFHFSKGDNTQNLCASGNFCIAKNKVSISWEWIPFEFYNMTDTMKRERHVYYKYYNYNQAAGDVIINTTVNLLNKRRPDVQLAVRIGVRLPLSTYKGLAAARFTDATGYTIDVSFGKPLSSSLKWIGMLGVYAWQINQGNLRQNDAFLFGSGLEWNKKNWKVQSSVQGYLGYEYKSGDKPIVFRINAEKKFSNKTLLLRFQQGINEFKYTSFELGMKYNFR